MIIAIDGPAGAGKSTVAKELARKFGFTYIDTGAMYRALTLKALQEIVSVNDSAGLELLLKKTEIALAPDQKNNILRIIMDGTEITEDIRQPAVTNSVSAVASHENIRRIMVEKQRLLAKDHQGIVMDGRDIGTVVFPNAELKVFLTASASERAVRRFREQQAKGIFTEIEELTKEIKNRDELDMNREASPLKPAEDSIFVDTTGLSLAEVITKISELVQKKNLKSLIQYN